MAWEQILTDGTPTNKLSDVDEAGSADGDLLIWHAGDAAYKTNLLGGDANEIAVTNTAGGVSVGLNDTEVVIPAKLKVTSEFKLGDDIIRTNDGTATITINTANDAVTLAGDSFTLGSAGKIVDSADTVTITKTNIALAGAGSVSGALTVGGGYGSSGTTISAAGVITTDGDITTKGGDVQIIAGEGTAANILMQADDSDDAGDDWMMKAGTDDMFRIISDKGAAGEYGSAQELFIIKNNAAKLSSLVTVSGKLAVMGSTLTVGGDSTLVSASNVLTVTEGTIALTGEVTASAGLDVTDDVIVQGGKITMSNGSIISSESAGVLALTEDVVSTSGNLKVGGNVIQASDGGSTITMDTSDNVAVAGNLTVEGQAIKGNAGNTCITLESGAGSNGVTIAGDLTVSGATTTIDTATIMLEDNLIYMNSGLGAGVAPTADAGLTVNRGSATNNASFFWDESSDGSTSTTSNNASATPGGAWAMGYTESAASGQTTISNVTGWVVGVTHHTSGSAAVDERATGLGSLFVNTTTDAVYIRVS